MKELIVLAIIIENLIFATVCGWWEGCLDSVFWKTEKIAGRKKHTMYMIVRSVFWITAAATISPLYWPEGWRVVLICLSCIFIAILTHFRLLQVGYYHITRNIHDAEVSPDRFFQDNDGKSHSWWDPILGRSFLSRMAWALIGSCVFIFWLFCGNFYC